MNSAIDRAEAGCDGRRLHELSEECPSTSGQDVQLGEFSWPDLVARTLHPLKVAIIEAMLFLGHPLSPKEMTEMLPPGEYKLDLVSHHFASLVRLGVLERREIHQVRGALKTYHFIAPALLGATA